MANYDDRDAAIEITLRTLWTWLQNDDVRRLAIIREAVLNFDNRPEIQATPRTWLVPGKPSYDRGIHLTHIIMSASLYGWHLSGLSDTTTLRKHVNNMLIKTQKHVQNLDKANLHTYIVKRVECLCELAYVFLLFHRTEAHPTDESTTLTFVGQLAHHVAKMCHQDDAPDFAPTTMHTDKRAHCLITALQLLATTPPTAGVSDPHEQASHVHNALPPTSNGHPDDTPPASSGPTRVDPPPRRQGTTRPREDPVPQRIGTRTTTGNFAGCEWGNEGGPYLLRGYLYRESDTGHAPPLYLAQTDWLQDESGIAGTHTRGLFAGRKHTRLEPITTYAGVVTYMDTVNEASLTKDDKSYLRTFMHKERCALDGFRTPKEGYGMAQFANDKRGEQPPNAEFIIIQTANMPGVQPRNRELGIYIRALRDIEKDEEIIITYDPGYFKEYDSVKPEPKRPKPAPPHTRSKKRALTDEKSAKRDKCSRTDSAKHPAQKHNNTLDTSATDTVTNTAIHTAAGHNDTPDTSATGTITPSAQRLHRTPNISNTHPHPHPPPTHHTHTHHTPPHPPPPEGGMEESGKRNGGGSPSVGGSSDAPGVRAPTGLATGASPTHTAGTDWRRHLVSVAGRVTARLRPLQRHLGPGPRTRDPGRPPPSFPPSRDGDERPLRCSGWDQNATRSPKSGAPQAAMSCSQALDPPDANLGWRIGPQHPPSWWCTSCTPPHRGRDVEPCSTYGCDSLVCYLFTAAHPAEMIRLATDRQHRRCITCITDPPGWD
jgi:hypothetical protein